MLTGHDEVSDRGFALDAGVDNYLVKPFRLMSSWRVCGLFSVDVGRLRRVHLISSSCLAGLSWISRQKKAAVSGLTLLLLNKEYELLERLMLADTQCCVAGDLLVSL